MTRESDQDVSGTGFDHERVANAVRELLIGIGEDPDREGLRKTPDRVA
nr:GTP cyclohydrolase I FolE [Micromonospora sp. DSM 115978]